MLSDLSYETFIFIEKTHIKLTILYNVDCTSVAVNDYSVVINGF